MDLYWYCLGTGACCALCTWLPVRLYVSERGETKRLGGLLAAEQRHRARLQVEKLQATKTKVWATAITPRPPPLPDCDEED